MTDEVLTTTEIGALLGHTNPASTRRWIANRGLKAEGRNTETGEKFYLVADVERAEAEAPGQGRRTSRPGGSSAAKEPDRDHDPGPIPD